MKTLKIKNLFVVCVLSLVFIQPAISQNGTTFGTPDCGQWVANSKSNFSTKTWLLGFMSGINTGLSKPKDDPLSKVNSAEQIYLWMDNFCQKNPLQTVQDGGLALFIELSLFGNGR